VSGATLASYVALGSTGCTIGGLDFSNFAWVPTGASPGVPPPATSVTVTDLVNANGTGFELLFGSSMTFTGNGNSDGQLSFTVSTVSTLAAITSLYQQIDGTATGTGSFDDLLENYCLGISSLGCTPLLAQESKLAPSGSCGPGTTDGSGGCLNSASFAAQSVIAVRKDIDANATAGSTGAAASVTDVYNQFGPAVPEPGTYVLSFIGLGLLFFGKRRLSRS